MFDYPMQTLCIKCKKPVNCGLFSLVRHGRPLCPDCLVIEPALQSVAQVRNQQANPEQGDDFNQSSHDDDSTV